MPRGALRYHMGQWVPFNHLYDIRNRGYLRGAGLSGVSRGASSDRGFLELYNF